MEKLMETVVAILGGSKVTLELFLITLIMALPLGLLVSLARVSGLKLLSRLMELYIWIMRGTPLMGPNPIRVTKILPQLQLRGAAVFL